MHVPAHSPPPLIVYLSEPRLWPFPSLYTLVRGAARPPCSCMAHPGSAARLCCCLRAHAGHSSHSTRLAVRARVARDAVTDFDGRSAASFRYVAPAACPGRPACLACVVHCDVAWPAAVPASGGGVGPAWMCWVPALQPGCTTAVFCEASGHHTAASKCKVWLVHVGPCPLPVTMQAPHMPRTRAQQQQPVFGTCLVLRRKDRSDAHLPCTTTRVACTAARQTCPPGGCAGGRPHHSAHYGDLQLLRQAGVVATRAPVRARMYCLLPASTRVQLTLMGPDHEAQQ